MFYLDVLKLLAITYPNCERIVLITDIGVRMNEKTKLGHGSLSRDTELLTPTGWLNIEEVTKETLVAQYWKDGQISFTQPVYVNDTYTELAVRLYNEKGHFDQLIGYYHSTPYVTDDGFLTITSAKNATNGSHRKYINTGILCQDNDKILTPVERVAIAFQADGHRRIRKESDYIVFGLRKNAKITRLDSLLKESNIKHTLSLKNRDGYTYYYVSTSTNAFDKNFDWVDLSKVDAKWCLDFIEEIGYWDATVRPSTNFRCQYFNNRKLAVDRVQAIATLAGYRTCLSSRIREGTNWNRTYTLSISGQRKSILGEIILKDIMQYDDIMYQVMTPSKMIVIRRNDAVSISGCQNYMLPNNLVINKNCKHLT